MRKPYCYQRKVFILCVFILMLVEVFFTACQQTCKHEWIPATCTEPKKCSKCGAIEGEALGHEKVTDNAVDATFSQTGKTEGSHCLRCGSVLVAQVDIPAKKEALINEIQTDPDKYSNGLYEKTYFSPSFADKSKYVVTNWAYPDFQNGIYSLTIDYDKNDETIRFTLFRVADREPDTLFRIIIDGGVISKRYTYHYASYNSYGYEHTVVGTLDAESLYRMEPIRFTSYYGATSRQIEGFRESYERESGWYAEQLVVMLDQLFDHLGLDVRAIDFNLK